MFSTLSFEVSVGSRACSAHQHLGLLVAAPGRCELMARAIVICMHSLKPATACNLHAGTRSQPVAVPCM